MSNLTYCINHHVSNKISSSSSSSTINQSSDIVYELDWSIRDKILSYLNLNSSLLFGNSISEEVKERMMKENIELYTILINLPSKSTKLDKSSDEDHVSNKLILNLTFDLRMSIIDSLISNYSLINLLNDSISKSFKMKIINRNKNLIFNLLNMSVKIKDGLVNELNSINDELNKTDRDNRLVKRARLNKLDKDSDKLVK
jgi:hypothetical protein